MNILHLAHMPNYLKQLLCGSLLLTFLLSLGWILNQSFSVRQWNISASASVKSDIEKYLSSSKNLDFWHSRPSTLRQQLLQHIPDLEDVHIKRQLPDRLIIHVTPRQAIALWKQEQGQLYLVDQHGVAYRARMRGETSNLPVLRMKRHRIKEACALLDYLHQKQPHWFNRSSELVAERGGWKLNLSQGQQWKLPFGPYALRNATQISQILAQPRWQARNWRVNTRFENRWYLRPATHEGVI
ncbi:MAG: FtsQ-type POTRA domain-containing protein [Mariprofundaceae bacterium]